MRIGEREMCPCIFTRIGVINLLTRANVKSGLLVVLWIALNLRFCAIVNKKTGLTGS